MTRRTTGTPRLRRLALLRALRLPLLRLLTPLLRLLTLLLRLLPRLLRLLPRLLRLLPRLLLRLLPLLLLRLLPLLLLLPLLPSSRPFESTMRGSKRLRRSFSTRHGYASYSFFSL